MTRCARRGCAKDERAEVTCEDGAGSTGTALACLAVLDGVPAGEAVAFVREHYDARAVETPWRHRYILRFCTAWRPSRCAIDVPSSSATAGAGVSVLLRRRAERKYA